MSNLKRTMAGLLVLCLIISLFSSCAKQNNSDNNTLHITLISQSAPQISAALHAKFPDINFEITEYPGSNFSGYQKERLLRGEAGDIFFYTTFYNSNDAKKHLVDLSGYPFLTNYDRAILSYLDVDGAIYQIPGPITVRYVAVNKTLFEEHGWEIPDNFNDVVDVCKQIRREAPEIVPLGLGMASPGYVFTPVTSYAQMGYLDTAEGKEAEKNYRLGTASFGEAFGEGLDMMSELIDAGAFTPEKFEKTADIQPEQIGNREVAMCYIMSSDPRHTQLFSGNAKGDPAFGKYSDDEFVTLPLYGRSQKNKGLILGTSSTWAISKKLEEHGNEKKLKNALRVLEYISSEEGQLAIRTNPSAIPAIKDLKSSDVPEFMRTLWNDSTNSIKSFFIYTGYEHMMIETAKILSSAMYARSSKGLKESFIEKADELNQEFLSGSMAKSAYGYSKSDLSVKDSRQLCCMAFKKTAKADIAIASEGGRKNSVENPNGLAGNLFSGDITPESLTILVMSKTLNVVSTQMSGREIKDLLKKGKVLGGESFTYWSSGIKSFDDHTVYTVAMPDGDYSNEFAKTHEFVDTGINTIDSIAKHIKALEIIE